MTFFYKNALMGGVTAPLCMDYKRKWNKCRGDAEKLVTLALGQQAIPYLITHCEKGKGLSKEYIMENFGDFINGAVVEGADGVDGYTSSLYVGFEGEIKPDADVICLMWCDIPTLELKATTCKILYIGAHTKVNIVCDGYNAPRIYLFDDSSVNLEDIDSDSEVVIYKYSDRCEVTKGKYCLGTIKEHRKELRL